MNEGPDSFILDGVIKNASSNFGSGALTYVGEKAFAKTVEKSYILTSRPMNNKYRKQDAKMLGESGGKAFNIGMYGNTLQEDLGRYNSWTATSGAVTLDTLSFAHDMKVIKGPKSEELIKHNNKNNKIDTKSQTKTGKVKPVKIKPGKNKGVFAAKLIVYELGEAGVKGTAIDTAKDYLERIDQHLENVEEERRQKAREFWPFSK